MIIDFLFFFVLPAVSYRLSFISFPPRVIVVVYFSNTEGAYFCFWHTKKKDFQL